MSTNWANRTKAATKTVASTVPSRNRGTRHEGVVETFEPTSFSTGSLGVKIKYAVAGLNRAVYENIVLSKLNAEGILEATKYGESSLKRRLQAFGLDSDAVNQFPIPRTPKAESEAYNFQGTPVALYLADEEYMGRDGSPRTAKRVTAVYPVDGE